MTRATPPVNMAHSVHDRLLKLAKQRGRTFNELLQYYAMERFLYRLANSPAGRRFVLKGALLLTACANAPYRSTRDIDLLGQGETSETSVRDMMQAACRQKVPDDGLRFDPSSVDTEHIRKDTDYVGVRVQFAGHLGNARIAMQVDVGFGDAITPVPRMIEYPVLLDFPAPRLRAYHLETAMAEKLHAMFALGELNSRMKDFYDGWMLSQHAGLDRKRLHAAIRDTFNRRKMAVPAHPVCFTPSFAASRQSAWRAFLRKLGATDVPENLATVTHDIDTFVAPILTERRLVERINEKLDQMSGK